MFSKRIKAVASFIPPAKLIADVGCDHGYLIIEAFLNQNITYAVAIDNKQQPLTAAIRNISLYPFYRQVRFSLSDGFCDLKEEVEAIILSGIGGINALRIIQRDPEKVKNARLIIQANRNIYDLRKGLAQLKFSITKEQIIKEGQHFYEILEFSKTDYCPQYTTAELEYGPLLINEKSPIFKEKLKKELVRYQKIALSAQEIQERIKIIEEILW
ncbi:MAG: class I SAM-dependent methyltransferase [Bacilli bacterium]|nr:class I SAM-dependent methyltransferase [Bacilli bacterium]MDD4077234.1 class I SAM-dependent methyltransferase [Bacilli bacterium]